MRWGGGGGGGGGGGRGGEDEEVMAEKQGKVVWYTIKENKEGNG